ncbi:MAG TPA: RsmG family class I SAM-dependent methyltransferase [Acidimicrobiales bacterium]|nr:RsmG family class I SAM-dependent methyltransferase [Acidimicrobiales bacterium]
MNAGPADSALLAVLDASKAAGFLGPGPAAAHVAHGMGFVAAWLAVRPDRDPRCLLDLGSGGGVPGLVLAFAWPDTEVVLLDGSAKRTGWLADAVAGLDLEDRVRVVAARAEEAGRGPLRGAVELVTARSFGPPAVTAECAAGFLAPDGVLLVAEPPARAGAAGFRDAGAPADADSPAGGADDPAGADDPVETDRPAGTHAAAGGTPRWPADGLAQLGLEPGLRLTTPVHIQAIHRHGAVPDRYPRRVGVPAKRPLWTEPADR